MSSDVPPPCSTSLTGSLLVPLRRWIVPVAIVVTALSAMTNNVVDPDLWGHVVYGREVLEEGRLPQTTTWSYVTSETPWINHENIAELALAIAADQGGAWGLSLGKLAMGLLLVGCMIWTARQGGAGWLLTGLMVVVAADACEFHWHFRPHLFTYVCFGVSVAIVSYAFHGWQAALEEPLPAPQIISRLHWLWALIPVMVFWTNSHGGFAAGVALLGTLLAMRIVQAAWSWRRHGLKPIGILAAVGASLVVSTVLNPYGLGLHAWMWMSVGTPRPEISDWRPLDLLDPGASGTVWVLMGSTAIALFDPRLRRDWPRCVLLGLTLWQGLSHCRHIVFYAILCGCWIPVSLQAVARRILSGAKLDVPALRDFVRPVAVSPGLAGVLMVWVGWVVVATLPRCESLPVRHDWYPVSAMQYVADQRLEGKFLVDFNWAQYAIMCFAEQPGQPSRVAVDGRFRTCYPRELLDLYLDFNLGRPGEVPRYRSPDSPPFNETFALEFQSPDFVLIARDEKNAVRVMAAQDRDWTLLYEDELAQLWGRRSRFGDPASEDYIPPHRRDLRGLSQTGTTAWPALPRRAPATLQAEWSGSSSISG